MKTQIIHLVSTVPHYSTWEISRASLQISKIISEDYHKNITEIDQEFNVQLIASTCVDCMPYGFTF